jgi:hypothetical protein
MKQRYEVFNIFRKFKCFVERQSCCLIKVLRSDRGKEYTSSQFHKFCEGESMKRQLTASYIPPTKWGIRKEELNSNGNGQINVA